MNDPALRLGFSNEEAIFVPRRTVADDSCDLAQIATRATSSARVGDVLLGKARDPIGQMIEDVAELLYASADERQIDDREIV